MNDNKKSIEDIDETLLKEMYTTMIRIRKFEERIGELVGQGKIETPCHLYIGQEAIATGICSSLDKEDFMFGNHRSHGHYIAKGGDLKKLMAEINTKADGCCGGKGGSMHVIAPEVGLLGTPPIVAASVPLAAGAALAAKLKGTSQVAIVFFGDGATNEGVFYETLNIASLHKLPVIFVCENNLYATHMPIEECSADTDISKKGETFDVPGIKVNGNDVIEVYEKIGKAIANARNGNGPTLVECLTYRHKGHVGPCDDLDKGLRSREELDSWLEKCPIKTLEREMEEKEILNDIEKEDILNRISEEIKQAEEFSEASSSPQKESLFKDVFK